MEGFGDVQTLDEALEMAQEGTVIKLCEGVHLSRATIRKGGIKIEPYYKDRLVYLLGNDGPAIKIDVPMDDPDDLEEASKKQVILKQIVLAHTGEAIVKNFKDMQLPKAFTDILKKKPNNKVLREMYLEPDMNTLVMVKSGGILMRNCLLTLRTLPKELKRSVPAFVALPKTHVSIINCDFIGGSGQNLTQALVFMNPSTVILSICRFTRFRGGAVYAVCEAKDPINETRGTEFLMQDCKIEEGAITGIYLAGPGAK